MVARLFSPSLSSTPLGGQSAVAWEQQNPSGRKELFARDTLRLLCEATEWTEDGVGASLPSIGSRGDRLSETEKSAGPMD